MTAATEAELQARDAGLRYVSDDIPGIRRGTLRGRFRYTDAAGRVIRDDATLKRIARLAVPPAYSDVWICPYPNGHIQATGRDARGRKQYRYHARWREIRDATKFERILEFAAALPHVRHAVSGDLKRAGMPKEKVLAAVVTLLETTLIRVGNEEYARANDSFGLTTLRNRHVRVRGARLRFEFKGKSGIRHQVDLHDRRLARIVAQCQELPGQHLFSYVDDDGNVTAIDSTDVNDYIRNVSQGDFTAKDFRTWLATVCCAQWLAANPVPDVKHRNAMVVAAFKFVAGRLRNTAAVCRTCYVHPSIVERYLSAGHLDVASAKLRGNRELQPAERAAVAIVREVAASLEEGASQTGIVDALHRSVRREHKRQRNGTRAVRKPGSR